VLSPEFSKKIFKWGDRLSLKQGPGARTRTCYPERENTRTQALGTHKQVGAIQGLRAGKKQATWESSKTQELGSHIFLGRKHRDIGAANRLSVTLREHKVKEKTRALALGTHRHSGRKQGPWRWEHTGTPGENKDPGAMNTQPRREKTRTGH
jgi:hypothetical protein